MNDSTQQLLDTDKLPFLLFDIGGTNTRIGVSLDGQTIARSEIFKTPKDFEQGMNTFERVARELLLGKQPAIMAGGVAGPLTLDKSGIVNAQNLVAWSGQPLKLELATRFGCEVYLENDAAMCVLGEAVFGAGKNYSLVAYLTISTGVNGVRVVNQTLDIAHGTVEIGDMIIDLDGTTRHADLESLISGAALERRYGQSPSEITNPGVWEDVARYAAYGITNMIVFWAPDVIVLGGSVVKKLSVERVKSHVKNILKLHPSIPAFAKAELTDLGGLWGALHYLTNLQKERQQ